MSAGVPIIFTDAELDHINVWMSLHHDVSNQFAPDGAKAYVPGKVRDALIAHALRDYANGLVARRCDSRDPAEVAELFKLALVAQTKVCSISSLPLYRFELACIYDAAGDYVASRALFAQFLRDQAAFEPSPEDSIFLSQLPYDMVDVVHLAVTKSF